MIPLSDPYLTTLINISLFLFLTILVLILKYIFPKKKINPIILLLVISILPILSLFRPGTFEAGDMRTHTAHLISFYHILSEGIKIPTWAGELCGGYGCPVFQFEYILPYYLGSLFHLIGFSFLTSIKLLLATSFISSGIAMYYWGKEEFGKTGGFASSILYLFAPYHLADVHFRGSVGEVLSFVFIPLLFLFVKRLIEKNHLKYFFLTAFTIIALILSHAATSLIMIPMAFGYGILIFLRQKQKNPKDILLLLSSFVYGGLASAFYWLPAKEEFKFTWQSNAIPGEFMKALDYIISPFGFGFLFQGHGGGVQPNVGYIHVLIIISAIITLLKKRIDKKFKLLLIYLLINFMVLFFMMLDVSSLVWRNVPLLDTFVVVWRLLVPIAFITAAISGIVFVGVKNKKIVVVVCYLAIALTILNWANRKMVPEHIDPLGSENEFYTEYFDKNKKIYSERRKVRIFRREEIVALPDPPPVEVLEGKGEIVNVQRLQETHRYKILAKSDVLIRENTLYFPGWTVFANGKEVPINFENEKKDSFGKITFLLKKGNHKVDVIYKDTRIRDFGKKISIVTLLLGFLLAIIIRMRKVGG